MFEILASVLTGVVIKWHAPEVVVQEHYRWRNTVLVDPHGIKDFHGNEMQAPYIDPPIDGWYYERADHSSWYWDNNDCEECLEKYKVSNWWKQNTFTFKDKPSDPRLKGDETIDFKTCLVFIPLNEEVECFNWQLTANGNYVIY